MTVPLLTRAEGLTKYCSWGAWYQDGSVLVPHVRKLATNGHHFAKVAKFECKDTAELIREFLEEYQVKLGHTYLLDTALGAYEAWGPNNNGDAFREQDLMVDSDDHGYRSFKKHAHVFRHHKNQDPNLAVGKVVLAAYNREMKRVEVIEELNNARAGDLLAKWEYEGSLPTSMGCKVAYDVCSICNNRAPSARQYCDHAKYAMGRVWEDGRKVCVWNPNPKFFDQSHVIIPAEKIAGTMMKVASANDIDVDIETPECVPSAIAGELRNVIEIQEEAEKVAAVSMDEGDVVWTAKNIADTDPDLPLEVLDGLRQFPLHKVASTLTYLGIVPKPEEWQYLALCDSGYQDEAAAFHKAGVCFDPDDCEIPELDDGDMAMVQPHFTDTKIARLIGGYVEQRSLLPQFLAGRVEAYHSKYADDKAVVPEEKIRKGEPSIPATMAALGVSYGLMRAIQGANKDTLLGIKGKLGTDPVISALLIAAGVAAALRLGSSAMEKKPDEKAKVKLSSLLEGVSYGSCTTTPWGGKTAASKGLGTWLTETPESVKSVVLPFGLGYMSSAYYRAKQMQGQPTSAVQNVVAEHPLAAGVGAVGAAAAVRRALKR